MKLPNSASFLAAAAIAIPLVATLSPEAQAQSTTFVCGTSNGAPATIAQTKNGNIPVIRWTSDHFSDSGYPPQIRCEMVSGRFQEYNQNNSLNYLTTGKMNGMPVICTTTHQGGSCQDLLFTLKPGQNPNSTLRNLMDIRVGARGPLQESSGDDYITQNSSGQVYVNMTGFINYSLAHTESTSENVEILPNVTGGSSTGVRAW